MCDGGLTDDGRQIGYCATCDIRACAVGHGPGGPVSCAHCANDACDRLERFFAHATDARSVLDEIRTTL
jgi:hypothetical protein